MCTAIGFKTKCFYFGRTLDYDSSYGESIAFTPRNFAFNFQNVDIIREHYAILGVAHVEDNCPMYYDAVNEKGLAVAGLNFVGSAFYADIIDDKFNICPHEFIPFVLGQCGSADEAAELLKKVNIINGSPKDFPIAQLHWIIADKNSALTVESTRNGFFVYDNPICILANNPEFPQQLLQLSNYMHLSAKQPENTFCRSLDLTQYSRGMGAIGLPGDWSSESRFARAAFVKENSVCGGSESESVCQFFRIMETISLPRGCCDMGGGKYQTTFYTGCCNLDRGIYYYTTYENHQISAIDMHRENLNGCCLKCCPLINEERINFQNL